LDIGSSAVKLIELQKKRGGYHMSAFSSVALPEDTVVDGEIINHTAVVDAVKAAIKEGRPKGKLVCISVAGASVIIKHILMPPAKPQELDDQVYWEAEQYIPFEMSEISLDYEIVNPDAGDGKMDVLLVAAKKDSIEKRDSVVRDCGLATEFVDVDAIALANVFWSNYDLASGAGAILIDIGSNHTKINVVDVKTTLFTRDVAVGGKNLSQEIQNKLNISAQEAETIKIDACVSGQIPDEIAPIINMISESITLEVRRSIDFYSAANQGVQISGIYLAGGSCRIPGLQKMLEEMTGLPTDFLNPFAKITYDKKFNEQFIGAIAPLAVVPLGLALRSHL
jgi:type IV pilus assembly protein PilM